jgi:hypothetical protein
MRKLKIKYIYYATPSDCGADALMQLNFLHISRNNDIPNIYYYQLVSGIGRRLMDTQY